MYLQILVLPEQRDYQRLLWRFDHQEPLQEYRLNCVTFGVRSSPYLAIRTVQELVASIADKCSRASQVLLEDIFMDDICSGSINLEGVIQLRAELITVLKSAGF